MAEFTEDQLEVFREVFDMFDADRSGAIERGELEKVFRERGLEYTPGSAWVCALNTRGCGGPVKIERRHPPYPLTAGWYHLCKKKRPFPQTSEKNS